MAGFPETESRIGLKLYTPSPFPCSRSSFDNQGPGRDKGGGEFGVSARETIPI
jgi:hypothetical protein